MTTHSICHRDEAQRGLYCEGVFVSTTNAADVTDSGCLQESWHGSPGWRNRHSGSNVGTRRPAPQTSCLRAGRRTVYGTQKRPSRSAERSPTKISGNRSGIWTSGGMGPGTHGGLRGQKTDSRHVRERCPTNGSPSREPRRPSRVLGPRKIWTTGLDADTLNGCGSFTVRQGMELSVNGPNIESARDTLLFMRGVESGRRRGALNGRDLDSRREALRGAPQEIRQWLE